VSVLAGDQPLTVVPRVHDMVCPFFS